MTLRFCDTAPTSLAARLPMPVATALALLAGLLQAAALVPPGGASEPLWWLQLLALGLLAWLLDGRPENRTESRTHWRHGAWLGGLFGLAWLTGTFWWLFISLHTYGGLPAWLAVLAVLGLAGVLALYYAAATALYLRWRPHRSGLRPLLFAALWLLAELARARWFTGFGWGGSGYAHLHGPLAGYAPWIGVFGIGAVAAWLAMSLAQLRTASVWLRVMVLAVLALPALWQMAGHRFTAPAGQLDVALLQGNIPQDEKFQPGSGVPMALQWYGEQLRDNTAPLVVAPETALPLLPQQLPPGYEEALRARYASGEQAALIGQPLGSLRSGYTNSAVGLRPGAAEPWRYDKHHLVPFGEFIPPLFKWFTAMMNIPLGDFNRGPLDQPAFVWQGQRIAVHICYEDLFGEELAAHFADADQAPTVFANLSNIAWFGDSVAIAQHLNISRMRALEFERPFLRATNTGATALISPSGEVQALLPPHTRGVLRGTEEGRQGLTPYARWAARWGLWPLWLGALGVVLLAALRARRRPSRFLHP